MWCCGFSSSYWRCRQHLTLLCRKPSLFTVCTIIMLDLTVSTLPRTNRLIRRSPIVASPPEATQYCRIAIWPYDSFSCAVCKSLSVCLSVIGCLSYPHPQRVQGGPCRPQHRQDLRGGRGHPPAECSHGVQVHQAQRQPPVPRLRQRGTSKNMLAQSAPVCCILELSLVSAACMASTGVVFGCRCLRSCCGKRLLVLSRCTHSS